MSGLAAIVRFDGSDVPAGAIERITAQQAHRGPDGITHWRKGTAALGFCALNALPVGDDAPQPLVDGQAGTAIAFTGYLHHRDELIAALGPGTDAPDQATDAGLVLRAYQRWGEECAPRIEGEFAFVIWDETARKVFCARDHAGLRPLFYHFDGRQLVVASEIAAVLAAPGVPQETNERMIAQIMGNDLRTADETVWRGVMRLPAAGCARFDRKGMHRTSYWMPPGEVTLRYAREEDYFEHYRTLLVDCVRQVSRSRTPLGIDVSGGLDSSAIFVVADALEREQRLGAPGFRGYTLRFAEGSEADEIAYAHAVADHVGRPLREVAPFEPDLDWFVSRGLADRDACPYPNAALAAGIGMALVADGCRVWINGEGGDEWLGGRPFYLSEQIAAGDFAQAWRSFREDGEAIGMRRALWRLYRFGLAPHTPAFLRKLRRKVAVPRGPNNYGSAFWLTPELDGLLAHLRSEEDFAAALSYTNIAKRAMYMELKDPFDNTMRDQVERQCARLGYEARSPMFARRFVEFAFSTPERMRLRGDQRKYTHVNAMRGLLPEDVRTRNTKADFSLAFEQQLDKMEQVLVSDLPAQGPTRLSALGMKRLFAEYRLGSSDDKPVWELWGVFACQAPGHLVSRIGTEIVE